MTNFKYLIFLFVISCSTQQLEVRKLGTVPGYDVLGVAKYCRTYLTAPTLPGVSTLLVSFGDPLPCIERKILQGGITTVQVDLMDATCVRNNVCPPGTPRLTDWDALRRRALSVNAIAKEYPSITWWISPWLEHDIKDPATVKKGCQVVTNACPTCRCINSPVSGATPAGIPIEKHGTTASSFSISSDGSSGFDGDNIAKDGNRFQHRLAGTSTTFFWWNELNGRCTGEKNFTPIPKRTAWPEAWQFNMAHKIMSTEEDPLPPVPRQCKTVRRITSPEINKPLAERYCNGDPDDGRGNKPLLIVKNRGQANQGLPIISPTGNQIGCFKYYGRYTDTALHRWYVGTCSRQNAWELYSANRSEWAYAVFPRGECLLFNTLRREGKYR